MLGDVVDSSSVPASSIGDRRAAPDTSPANTPAATPPNERATPAIEPATGTSRVAAFFDLDKTIIAKSSTLAFSRPLFKEGLINRRAVLKSAYAQFVFMLSGADSDQTDRMRDYITQLCGGWDVEQVRAIVDEALHDIVDPLVYAEAAELIAEHKAAGHDVVVISATGEEISAPIARILGATEAIGTRMVVADGRYTGEIDFYCYGENKASAITRLAEQHGYDLPACYGYTDSSTDLPMLEAVGRPCAVNPDKALRRAATDRGWPVVTFSNPVSLRSKMLSPSGTTLAVTAVGLGAVAAGATWYRLYRRRRR